MIKDTVLLMFPFFPEEVTFDIFKHFGIPERTWDVDKLKNFSDYERSSNGIFYLNKYANAFLSASVAETLISARTSMFIADVTDGEVLSQVPSVTYAYYHKHIKPQPQETKKTGWRCKICGYIYEGEELPADFICPICKHGASDFERIL